ncbi:putative glycerol proton symporter of the plasma subject to glucose-induced inactivation [Phaeomoniella chlamydospora]|uniref:Putative glycerol proton symporter of the plasma subject to glucose-induced inactivation n=1 Tax=Phaeomoniella chlamydospora TaxID=158046 RepID=A0A0G2EYQ7_PHACM|nr:putative glycerol proton symporter of the plasma subject to glucose-induced inactivation [Phaeomoniella chlamydospora]
MLDGYALEVTLTAANSAAQAWYGYDQGVVAGILISDHFLNSFPQIKRPNIEGIFTSSFSLGNLVGCLLAAFFGDKLGRKKTLLVGAFISATGAILQFSATTFAQLMSFDAKAGMTSSTCGVFQAESSRGPRRGKLSVIVVTHNVVFYMLGSWLTLGTARIDNDGQWRIPLALQLVPALVLCSLLPLVPESPRWLLLKDRHEEALEALRRYLGKNLSVDHEEVQYEYRSIRGAIELERKSQISFKQVLLCRDRSGHLKRMLLGCGTQFIQQMSGINALNYYFTIILETNLGMSDFIARVLYGANATSYCISTAMSFWMIDRFGRRSLMMGGLWLQFLAYVMVSIAVALLSKAPQQWGAVAISFLFFYYAAFGCTWGMVPWIYQAEVNSLAMRTRGAAAATATNWLFAFVCTQFTSTGIRNLGYKFYIIFAILNLVFIPVVYFLYPETANRTLEDLDEYFDRDSPHTTIIRFGDKVAKQHQRPIEAIEAEARRVATSKTDDLEDDDTKSKLPSALHVESIEDQERVA